ncbi:putative oxidoreductase At4g09670 [Silene latifolia]|uniref:putative oxidoreductase At4g09670 n=1 Tax=Silene latifolia TaxID=37657 RepID=UPI003D76E4A0
MSNPNPSPSSSSSAPIRFGIIGCADIARKLSRAILLSPNTTLHALGSRSLSKAQAFAKSNNYPPSTKLYASYDAVLDDPDVDAVYIPLPTSLHLTWAVAAARKGKHVLLEKPTALNVAELDQIIDACEEGGVQFMDGTMWTHHPRTRVMSDFLQDSQRFGQLHYVQTCFSFAADNDFLENDIRVSPDLDALGALGDCGWYCIRASLFAANYELPKSVTALRNPIKNKAGVLLSCGASLHWEDGRVATFNCSFLSHLTMNISAVGTKGTLRVTDFIIPYEEKSASFSTLSNGGFGEMTLAWKQKPSEHIVNTELPQEVVMVREFSTLVEGIKNRGLAPEKKWPTLTRKTQLVIDAVVASIAQGFEPIQI